ncbi:MAG: MFS transporter [Bacteroidota bacterium]
MRKLVNPNYPFHPGKWPFFYGWMILVWGTVGMLMSIPGQTMGVSVFTESLLLELNVNRDQLSLAYMLGTIGSAFMLPWMGRLYDRVGVRPIAILAGVSLGVVLLYLSQVDRIVEFLQSNPSVTLTFILIFIGFMLLRFTGQGVITMVSRNMMMKWFEQRRGLATGFSNVFVSLGFSIAPLVLDSIIVAYDWRMAWILVAAVVGIVFPVLVYFFFRDNPESSGLKPDGDYTMSARKKKYYFPVKKQFTVKEALRSYPFWVFASILAMQGLFITGFTFHIVSIFDEVGMSKEAAISVFQPIAWLAVAITLITSYLSDMIPLRYLLLIMGFGAMIGTVGLIFLGQFEYAYHLLIFGTGVVSGLFAVLASVTWPRFYGTLHLGAISSQSVMMMVFASAIGPILFSSSLTLTGSYSLAIWICFGIFGAITLAGFWAHNPQIKIPDPASNQ